MKVERVYAYAPATTGSPLVAAGVGDVPARFPSPAQEYSATQIDLTKLLINDGLSTFIVRASGDSMVDAGIFDGDELIVDRGIEPRDGHVVVAIIDGEMTVKRLRITATGVVLQPKIRFMLMSTLLSYQS